MKRYVETASTEPAPAVLGRTDFRRPSNRIATMQAELRTPDGTTRGPFGINELHSEIQKAFDDYLDSACIEMREAPNA
jgi:hypothetical protein